MVAGLTALQHKPSLLLQALYWLLLALFLQRGPVAPQEEELSVPEQRLLPALLLALPLLVLLPFPYTFGPLGGDF